MLPNEVLDVLTIIMSIFQFLIHQEINSYTRVLRDLGSLLVISTLGQTPLWVINGWVIFIHRICILFGIEP